MVDIETARGHWFISPSAVEKPRISSSESSLAFLILPHVPFRVAFGVLVYGLID